MRIFDFDSTEIVLYIKTRETTLCEQSVLYNGVQESDPTSASGTIMIGYSVNINEDNESQEEGTIAYTISGYIEGLTANTSYTLVVESCSETITQKSFSTSE